MSGLAKDRSAAVLAWAALAAASVAATREVTPGTGAQAVINAAKPGDTLVLAPGVYYECLSVTNSGAAEAPITIRAAKGGSATISGAAPDRWQPSRSSCPPISRPL